MSIVSAQHVKDVIIGYINGKTIQMLNVNNIWRDLSHAPNCDFSKENYRIKPVPKKIWVHDNHEYDWFEPKNDEDFKPLGYKLFEQVL